MILDTKDRKGSKTIKPSTRKCFGSLPGHRFHSFKSICQEVNQKDKTLARMCSMKESEHLPGHGAKRSKH